MLLGIDIVAFDPQIDPTRADLPGTIQVVFIIDYHRSTPSRW